MKCVSNAAKDRPVIVSFDQASQRPIARAKINGHMCRLERIWVQVGRAFSITNPMIDYVDVWGVDSNGKPVHERVRK